MSGLRRKFDESGITHDEVIYAVSVDGRISPDLGDMGIACSFYRYFRDDPNVTDVHIVEIVRDGSDVGVRRLSPVPSH